MEDKTAALCSVKKQRRLHQRPHRQGPNTKRAKGTSRSGERKLPIPKGGNPAHSKTLLEKEQLSQEHKGAKGRGEERAIPT